jgi:Arc/MetJ family transcription regulator
MRMNMVIDDKLMSDVLRATGLKTKREAVELVSGNRGVSSMTRRFRVGDHVSWNSEAGRVSGTVIAVHTADFDYKGHVHHASKDDPQYEIKSDKTDHIAAHKGSALKLERG